MSEAARPKVLVLEDDEDCARALAVILSDRYDVSVRRTGESTLFSYDTLRPDVIVIDYQLPDMTGLEVVERVRANGGGAIPIVLVSAICDRAGAFDDSVIDAFLAKPFDPAELIETIETLLGF